MIDVSLKTFLDKKVVEYNQPRFIEDDPISIPHLFSKKQDIEIAGFFSAIFSWGNRRTIINKSRELMRLMNDAPYDFCINHSDNDLKSLLNFTHRTFNTTDLLYFIDFFQFHYTKYDTLERAFTMMGQDIESMLNGFQDYFMSLPDAPSRTRKHIASPRNNSSCKRINMFLRWMVRCDAQKVDFGIWKNIPPSILICPIDLHVARVANRLGLIQGNHSGWKAANELTQKLRELDPTDPVKYDFALFGLGIIDKY